MRNYKKKSPWRPFIAAMAGWLNCKQLNVINSSACGEWNPQRTVGWLRETELVRKSWNCSQKIEQSPAEWPVRRKLLEGTVAGWRATWIPYVRIEGNEGIRWDCTPANAVACSALRDSWLAGSFEYCFEWNVKISHKSRPQFISHKSRPQFISHKFRAFCSDLCEFFHLNS